MTISWLMSITFILCILGLVFQKNIFLAIVQFIWITCITCFNTMSADWRANYDFYQNAENNRNFITPFINFFKINLNFDFYTFNGMMSFLSLCLIFFVILKETKRPSFVLTLWMIFPLIDNIIQKRYFWVFGIVILAIYFLLNVREKILALCLYEVLVLLAICFHAAYIWFIFLPVFLYLSRRVQLTFSISVVLLGVLFNNQIIFIANKFLTDLQEKNELYFGRISNHLLLALIIWGLWQTMQFYFIYCLYKKDDTKMAKLLIGTNIYFLMLIPLYLFDPVFARCFRPMLLFNYIGIANKINIISLENKLLVDKKIVYLILSFFVLILFTFYVFDVSSITSIGFDNIVKVIYQNNSLFN